MSLTDSQRKEVKASLLELEKQLGEEIQLAKKSSVPVELDQQAFGRVSRIDAIQQQKMSAAGLSRLELRLQKVKSAILRVDDDSFGLCAQCEEEIPLKRLLVSPESPVCVQCAQ